MPLYHDPEGAATPLAKLATWQHAQTPLEYQNRPARVTGLELLTRVATITLDWPEEELKLDVDLAASRLREK